MDSLFGVPINSIMIGLLVLMSISFAVLGWIAYRQPLLVRMGFRNIRRRVSQTILIVVGMMLATLIISAAFATGDTVGYSVTNSIYEQFEEADFVIVIDDDDAANRPEDFSEIAFLEDLQAKFSDDPGIDGITGSVGRTLPVLNLGARLSEPSALVVGLEPETADEFGGLRSLDGSPAMTAALSGDAAYITENLSEEIDAAPGSTVTVFFEGESIDVQVLDVVRDSAVTSQNGTSTGGLVLHIDSARALFGEEDSVDAIVVSATGGVRDTLEISDEVQGRLETFLEARPESGAEIAVTKKEFVSLGELIGSLFVTIFLIFGLFSISAGILLIFLIFIMLAAERRSEMGMARAVGMSRLNLTQTYIAEGMAYNIGAALVGALLGLGVSWLLIQILGQALNDPSIGFAIAFHASPQPFVIAYASGITITFATIAFSAWRAANLNIVRAIRDLPEPQPLSSRNASWSELLRATAGALWLVAWIALLTLLVTLGLAQGVFLLTLFYGLPLLAIVPIGFFYVSGMRDAAASRRRWLFWLWLVLLLPLSLPSFGLLKAKGWADRHRSGGGWAVVMLLLGTALTYFGGWQWGQAFAYASGISLVVLAAGMLAVYWGVSANRSLSIASLALVWFWLLPLPFSLLWEGGKGWIDPIDGLLSPFGLGPREIAGNIEMFFVSGVCITAAATIAVVFNSDFILGLASRCGRFMGGVAPAIRTAIAYPLAAKFRTGLTLAMFGLIVFSLVVMAFLNYNFSQLFIGAEAAAGFDVVASGNPSNRISDLETELRTAGYDVDRNLSGIGKVVSSFPEFREVGTDGPSGGFPLRGGNQEFFSLAEMPLQQRAQGYPSDEAVMAALAADPTLVIASAEILGSDDPFGDDDQFRVGLRPDDPAREVGFEPVGLIAQDPSSGETQELSLIGVFEPQVSGILLGLIGIFGQEQTAEALPGGSSSERYYIRAVDRSKSSEIQTARAIESTLLERGIEAYSIEQDIDAAAEQSTSFQLLFEGFMGLGLIVGIAALGVIAFRTVVERRQQIGMLRAIGYSKRLVATSFFFESSFIALTGVVMGVVLGSALSYNLLTSPEFTGGTELDFQVPWVRLALIVGIAYVASALTTIWPARSAASVAAAEALRYE